MRSLAHRRAAPEEEKPMHRRSAHAQLLGRRPSWSVLHGHAVCFNLSPILHPIHTFLLPPLSLAAGSSKTGTPIRVFRFQPAICAHFSGGDDTKAH